MTHLYYFISPSIGLKDTKKKWYGERKLGKNGILD